MMTIDDAALQEVTVRRSGASAERMSPEPIRRSNRKAVSACGLQGIEAAINRHHRDYGFRARANARPGMRMEKHAVSRNDDGSSNDVQHLMRSILILRRAGGPSRRMKAGMLLRMRPGLHGSRRIATRCSSP